MRGNAFKDVGSPHFEFHSVLESFWNQYRKGGEFFGSLPTNIQYGNAVTNALKSSGLKSSEAGTLSNQAAQNRAFYGIVETDTVPRIPSRLPQVKKK